MSQSARTMIKTN